MKREPYIPIVESPVRAGRGASYNPASRFEVLHYAEDPSELDDEELRKVTTQYLIDTSRTALARNSSPDVPFTFSLNPYRGCEHGCIYCYARPSHEYLGFSAGLDFETKIMVKQDAPKLLADAFESRSWEPQVVALSGNTDPYQPVERRLGLTRRCLEVFRDYGNPVAVITKNKLILRDLDLLADLAARNLVQATISITSLRRDLTRRMEPRTTTPESRFRIIEKLAAASIPVGVNIAPIIPGLTDEDMPGIIRRASEAGATRANYIVVRLPGPVRPLFLDWLRREFPHRADRVVGRIRELRAGNLTDPRFKTRHTGEGEWADVLNRLFSLSLKKYGMTHRRTRLSTEHFRRARERQLGLF